MFKIIQILSDGQFHSGEEIGKSINLTRSGIWKIVQQLQNQCGIEIESRKGLGYRIPGGLKLLSSHEIHAQLKPDLLAHSGPIELFTTLPSTSDYLLDLIARSRKAYSNQCHTTSANTIDMKSALGSNISNRVCIAEQQTKGKGRRGRDWISPFGQNIYLSLLWNFPKDLGELSGLSLSVGEAIMRSLQSMAFPIYHKTQFPDLTHSIGLKWPNDLVYNGKKVGGILIELCGETCDVSHAVIGIGLNVAMQPLSGKAINQPWTSLQTIMGRSIDRNVLISGLLNTLVSTLLQFEKEGLKPFLKEWRQHDIVDGANIRLETPHGILNGIGMGVDDRGCLLVKMIEDGLEKMIHAYSAGEIISLRHETLVPA